MPAIKKGFGQGQMGGHGKDLKGILDGLVADVAALRAGHNATNAQLDADATVTDTDYAANNDVAVGSVTSD